MPPSPADTADAVARVRHFNRVYTRLIGVLDRKHLASPFSLGEMRVLYEIAHWSDTRDEAPTASQIVQVLAVDPGYLSRTLRDFEAKGLIARSAADHDARQRELRLTAKGKRTFAGLETRAASAVEHMLAPIADGDRTRLLAAMRTVEEVLQPTAPSASSGLSYILRGPRAGDLGWVVSRHGALYSREFRWNADFEVLVARIATDFFAQHDPKRERCWIAERDGANGPENIGSVFIVQHPEREGVAKLRLLLVEPSARGIGLGKRLVDECTHFAREAGYHTITLWTNANLLAARGIYTAAGYRLVASEPYLGYGHALVGETWELSLVES